MAKQKISGHVEMRSLHTMLLPGPCGQNRKGEVLRLTELSHCCGPFNGIAI